MTCIVGVRHEGGVLLGADSLGVAGWDSTPRKDPKVFNLTPQIAAGYTSSFRMGQILRFHVQPPEIKGDEFEWAVRDFVPVIRAAFKDHDWERKDNDGARAGGTFLLAVRGRLFKVEDDFQVGEPIAAYEACGCGADFAEGALHALRDSLTPRARVKAALTAAVDHSAGVGPPFTFAETKA